MKTNRILPALLLLLIANSAASANNNRFAGKWKNVDPNTAGLTAIEIALEGKNVQVRAWGKCHPYDCAWGDATATTYIPRVESNQTDAAQGIAAIYDTPFAQIILIISPIENDRIEVEILTEFTDKSGRTHTREVERFSRESA